MKPDEKTAAEIAGRYMLKRNFETLCSIATEYNVDRQSVRRIRNRYLESAEMKSAALAAAERYYETHQLPAKRPKLCSQGHGNATYVAEKCPMNHFTHPALCRVHADAVPQPAAAAAAAAASATVRSEQLAHTVSDDLFLRCVNVIISQASSKPHISFDFNSSSQCRTGVPVETERLNAQPSLTAAHNALASGATLLTGASSADRISAQREFQLSPELEQRICQRKPNDKDSLVNKLEREGIRTIADCDECGRLGVTGWTEDELNVVFLDDSAWSKLWADNYIRRNLSDCPEKMLAEVVSIILDYGISCEKDLFVQFESLKMKFPFQARRALIQLKSASSAVLNNVVPTELLPAARDQGNAGPFEFSEDHPESRPPLAARLGFLAKTTLIVTPDPHRSRSEDSVHSREDSEMDAERLMEDNSLALCARRVATSKQSPERHRSSHLALTCAIRHTPSNIAESHLNYKISGAAYAVSNSKDDDKGQSCNSKGNQSGGPDLSSVTVAEVSPDATPVQSLMDAFRASTRFRNKLAMKDRKCKSDLHLTEDNIVSLERAVKDSLLSKTRVPFRKLSWEKIIGYGGFGIVFHVQSTESNGTKCNYAVKLEFDETGLESKDCAISRECQLYGMAREKNCPLPKLEGLFGNRHSFATCALNGTTTARLLCMELLYDWPQGILVASRELFLDEKRAGADGHDLYLKVMDALFYLEERGVQHNDFKPAHIMGRGDGSIVLIDCGLAQRKDVTYVPLKHQKRTPYRPTTQPPQLILGLPGLHSPFSVLGGSRIGTPGYRKKRSDPPDPMMNSFQFGMVLFRNICPQVARDQDENVEDLVYSLAALNFDKFKEKVLSHRSVIDQGSNRNLASSRAKRISVESGVTARSLSVHPDFGEEIMQLCYGLVQEDPRRRLTIRQALMSKFARNYIPSEMSWHNMVKDNGLVIEPTNGIPAHCVLVWSKERGYCVIPLFNFLEGDRAGLYVGVLEIKKKPGGKDTAANLSLHSIMWDATYSLNGTPCSKLTVEQMVKNGAYGSLFQSSRTRPQVRKPGNVISPNNAESKCQSTFEFPSKDSFSAVQMKVRTFIRFGIPFDWDYDWASMGSCGNQASTTAFTNEQIDEATHNHQELPSKWKEIVLLRRKELMAQGICDRLPSSTVAFINAVVTVRT
jgi:hypothetical protein